MASSILLKQSETHRIRSETVVVYVRRACGYCVRTLELLERHNVAPTVVDATRNPELRSWLLDATSQYTVPQIFIHGNSVGGYRELRSLELEGSLPNLLKDQTHEQSISRVG